MIGKSQLIERSLVVAECWVDIVEPGERAIGDSIEGFRGAHPPLSLQLGLDRLLS
jgi:hypothetical protein